MPITNLLENINYYLSGLIMPVLLISGGVWFGWKLKLFYIFHPIKLTADLRTASKDGGTSPFKALTLALAGTLGVGNISGVATAITAGGAGAVFWMWLSAAVAMSVKYAEAALSVHYRRMRTVNGRTTFFGGAMYYMRDGLKLPVLGGFFAVMLILNSLLTGNIVQVNAAASVYPDFPPIICGISIAALSFIISIGGAKRISDFTVKLIPFLSAVYLILSMYIIITNYSVIPSVFKQIFAEAFNFGSASGGVLGFTVSRAVRFGVTRGIFSNEAGCGTSPTAHASANTKSPHHQGCFGIFEVFADTILLCTMTAIVILLADKSSLDGIPLSLYAYSSFTGKAAGQIIGLSVILFAFATVICQSYYGIEAISFFTGSRKARLSYLFLSFASSIIGSVIPQGIMWQLADLVISIMTVINVACVMSMTKAVVMLNKAPVSENRLPKKIFQSGRNQKNTSYPSAT